MTIRPATKKDEKAVRALVRRCHPGAPVPAPGFYTREHTTLVAEAEGQIIGYTVYRVLPEGPGIGQDLGVAPEWRRQGIADQLYAARVAAMRAEGATHLIGLTRQDNAPMRKLIEAWGALPGTVMPGYYTDTDPPEDGIMYVLTFPKASHA